jgi:hypothetical protein
MSCPFTENVVNKPYAGREEKVKKYCSCLAKTAAKQPARCLPPRKAKSMLKPGCYNPYALCGKIFPKGGGRIKCTEVYDYDTMPSELVAAVAKLHGKSVAKLKEAKNVKGESKRST